MCRGHPLEGRALRAGDRRRWRWWRRWCGGPVWPWRRLPIEALERRALLAGAALSGTVFEDRDGDWVRDGAEPGAGGRAIYLDVDLDRFADFRGAAHSPIDLPRPIPDFSGVPGVLDSSITLSGLEGLVLDVDVIVRIDHPWVGDLELRLLAPDGTTVLLADNVGGGGDDYETTRFDDAADAPIAAGTPPFNGSFRPAWSLGSVNHIDPNGTWTLRILDTAGGDAGTLLNWWLALEVGDPRTTSQPDGTYAFFNLPPQSYLLRHVPEAGWIAREEHVEVPAGAPGVAGVDMAVARKGTISGHAFVDLDLDGARDGDDPAAAGATIYLDADGNGRRGGGSGTWSITDSGPGTPIPDQGTLTWSIGGGSSVGELVTDLNVELNILHPYTADLDIFLTSPSGTRVELLSDVAGTDFTGTVLDDEAALPIWGASGAHTGSFRPASPLSAFDGETFAGGMWTLEVTDDAAADLGRILRLDLYVELGDPSVRADATGGFTFTVPAGVYEVRQEPDPGWLATNPAGLLDEWTSFLESGAANVTNDFGAAPMGVLRGNVFDDLDADGLRGAAEPPLGGVAVYLDGDEDGRRDAQHMELTGAWGEVPWHGRFGFPLNVPDVAGSVRDLAVEVNVQHPSVGDLTIFLVSPRGRRVCLADRAGWGQPNFVQTVFRDDAATPIAAGTAPFTGPHRPEEPLSAMVGEPAYGTWYLEVRNHGHQPTVLSSWRLALDYGDVQVATTPGGDYVIPNLRPGDHVVRALPTGTWRQTAPPRNGGHSARLGLGQDLALPPFGLTDTQVPGTFGDDRFLVRLDATQAWVEV